MTDYDLGTASCGRARGASGATLLEDLSTAQLLFFNGDFEKGDLSGWEVVDGYGPCFCVADEVSKYSGIYGGHLTLYDVGDGAGETLRQGPMGQIVEGGRIWGHYKIKDADIVAGYAEMEIFLSQLDGECHQTLALVEDPVPGEWVAFDAEITSCANPMYCNVRVEIWSGDSGKFLEVYVDLFDAAGSDITHVRRGRSSPAATLQEVLPVSSAGRGRSALSMGIVVEVDIDEYNFGTEGVNVHKRIDDAMWAVQGTVIGIDVPDPFDHLKIWMGEHVVFWGFASAHNYSLNPANKIVALSGNDYSWFLSHQYGYYRHLRPWTSADGPDYDHPEVSEDTPPEEVVKRLIGYDPFASYWQIETGIHPYQINSVVGYGTTIPKKMFTINEDTTIWQTLQEIADHCNYALVIKWRDFGSIGYLPVLFFIPWQDIIDETYGPEFPPEAQEITFPDYYVTSLGIQKHALEKVNEVRVWGMEVDPSTDKWVTATVQTPARAAYDELAIQYNVKRPDLLTVVECAAVAAELLAILKDPPVTYKLSLQKRVDLELYQRVKFNGFDIIPPSWMRIIGISYRHNTPHRAISPGTSVEIEIVEDADFTKTIRMRQLLHSKISETKAVAKQTVKELVHEILMGTATATEGVFVLEKDGRTVPARVE